MLTCRELVTLVTEYLEGSLPFADQVRFQLHLGLCRDCRRYLRQMKETVEAQSPGTKFIVPLLML